MSGKNGRAGTIRAASTSTLPASSSIAAIREVTTSPCFAWTARAAASPSPAFTAPLAILRSSFSSILQCRVEITRFEGINHQLAVIPAAGKERKDIALVAITRIPGTALARCVLTHIERQAIDVGQALAQHRAYQNALRK